MPYETSQCGMILGASGMTGEKKIYSLAIAIAPVENEDNWDWFLTALVTAIPEINHPNVFIMSDRDKGLRAAQLSAIPNARSSICLQHLERNVKNKSKTNYDGKLWGAAKAASMGEYLTHMTDIRESPHFGREAFDYLESCKEDWATCYFPIPRFNILTSNTAESFNSSMKDMRTGSYLYLFFKFSFNFASSIFKNHQRVASKEGLTTSIIAKWKRVLKEGQKRKVTQVAPSVCVSPSANENEHVKSDRIVDLDNWTYSCGTF